MSNPILVSRRRCLGALGVTLSGAAMRARATGAGAPLAPLRLVSGDLPPFAMDTASGPRGGLVELSEAVLAHAGWSARTQFMPWARAVLEAQRSARTLVQPLTRTPERETQFQWVLLLSQQRFAFVNLRSARPVESLEQAKLMKVGVLRGSPHHPRLLSKGFDSRRVLTASSNDDLQRMLDMDLIQAIYGSEQITLYNGGLKGRQPERLQVGLVLDAGDIWLATGGGMEPTEIDRLRQSMAELQRQGVVRTLLAPYRLASPGPQP